MKSEEITTRQLIAWFFTGFVVLGVAGMITFAALSAQRAEVEKVEVIQGEKSERGHWLWGKFGRKEGTDE